MGKGRKSFKHNLLLDDKLACKHCEKDPEIDFNKYWQVGKPSPYFRVYDKEHRMNE
jgi:hypothetical protein